MTLDRLAEITAGGFSDVNKRLGHLGTRLEHVETRLGHVEDQLEEIKHQLKTLREEVENTSDVVELFLKKDVLGRLDRLEAAVYRK